MKNLPSALVALTTPQAINDILYVSSLTPNACNPVTPSEKPLSGALVVPLCDDLCDDKRFRKM